MQKNSQDSAKQLGFLILISLIWLIIGWVLRSVIFPNQINLEDEVRQVILQAKRALLAWCPT